MASHAEAEFRLHQLALEQGWPLADFECPHGAMAHDRLQRCFCFAEAPLPLTDLVDVLGQALHDAIEQNEEDRMQEEVVFCKNGDGNPAKSSMGRYAKLCEECISQAQLNGNGNGNGNGHVDVEQLLQPVSGGLLVSAAVAIEAQAEVVAEAQAELERQVEQLEKLLADRGALVG